MIGGWVCSLITSLLERSVIFNLYSKTLCYRFFSLSQCKILMVCGIASKIWVIPIPPRYEGIPWAVDWLVCLAPSHLQPRWIVKSRKSQFDFHELFRSRSFIINFSLLGHLCILGDNVFCSWCRVGSPQPVMCFTLNDHVVAMLTIRDVFDNEFFWKDWLPASHVILGHLTFYLFL